jgi:CheY-like chemotaxis protein
MKKQYNYLVIDDDPNNNLIINLTLKKYFDPRDIKVFTKPLEGLAFIKNSYLSDNKEPRTILLLDINMPGMSGWDFLIEFEKFDLEIQSHFTICMLSSSVDDRDLSKSKGYKSVDGYMVKPLKKEILLELLCELQLNNIEA